MSDLDRRLKEYQRFLDSEFPPVDVRDTLEQRHGLLETPGSDRRSRRSVFAIAFAAALLVGSTAVLATLGSEPVSQQVAASGSFADTTVPPEGTLAQSVTTTPATSTTVVPTSRTTVAPATPPPPLSDMHVHAALDDSGAVVVAALTRTDGLALVRCSDITCAEQVGDVVRVDDTITIEGDAVAGLEITGLALLDGTNPVVAYDLMDERPSEVLICHDARCAQTTTVELRLAASGPQVLVGPRDGLLRIVYWDHSSHDLAMVTCDDLQCGDVTRSIVVPDVLMPTRPDVAITSDDRLLVAYERELDGEFTGWVAQCVDTRCSDTVSFSLGEATEPRITDTDGSDFLVWYRQGSLWTTEGDASPSAMLESWDLTVAACDGDGCQPIRTLDAGWRLLQGWTDGARLYALGDGVTGVVHQSWSSDACAVIVHVVELDVARAEVSRILEFSEASAFDTVVATDGVALVFVDGQNLTAIDPTGSPDLPPPPGDCSEG
jgi:hypothetical protein